MVKYLVLLSAFLFYTGSSFAAKSIPASPINYVYDEANILQSSIGVLSSTLSQEDRQFGNQILVAVFNSLEQEDLVDYTNRLFAAWQPGEKAKSNGVLLAIYLKEKKMRIEVGYGLEPLLTDAKSKLIMIDILGPAFKNQQYIEGILGAVQEIRKIIHSDGTTPSRDERSAPRKRRSFSLFQLIFLGIFGLVFYLIDRFNPQTLGSNRYRSGSGWGGGFGGGSGWSGGGGGGFSGGGGSSGGGGASGDW